MIFWPPINPRRIAAPDPDPETRARLDLLDARVNRLEAELERLKPQAKQRPSNGFIAAMEGAADA